MDASNLIKNELRVLFPIYDWVDLNNPGDVASMKSQTIEAILRINNGMFKSKGRLKLDRSTPQPKLVIKWQLNDQTGRLEILLKPARFFDPYKAYHRAMGIV